MRSRTPLALVAWITVVAILAATSCTPPRPRFRPTSERALPTVERGEIVYQAEDDSIHAIGIDGKGDRQVSPPPRPLTGTDPGWIVAWLPEKGLVACVTLDGSVSWPSGTTRHGVYRQYLFDLASRTIWPLRGGETRLEGDMAADPDYVYFSLDGRKLHYESSFEDDLEPKAFVADVSTGEVVQVPHARAPSLDRAWRPSKNEGWSGGVLAASLDHQLLAVSSFSPDHGLGVFDRRTKKQTVINTRQYLYRTPSFSPDGRFLVFEDGRGVRVTTVDGKKHWSIAHGVRPVFWPGR